MEGQNGRPPVRQPQTQPVRQPQPARPATKHVTNMPAKQARELSSSKGKGHTKEIALVILAAVTAVVILVALLVLKLPVLPVILIVAIEIAMGACLQKVPLWLHGAVVAAQIVVGALTGNVVFFLLGGGLYFISVLSIGLVFFSSRRTKAHAG